MNPRKTLQTTFWAMIALQTIGSVDLPNPKRTKSSPLGGAGTRKLPSPRVYVAVVALWSILSLMAEGSLGRLAARLSVLVLLTGAVFGPFGTRLVSFLEGVSRRFAITPPAPGSSSPAGGNSGSGGVTGVLTTTAEALL